MLWLAAALALVAAVGVLALHNGSDGVADSSQQPNVILIVSDDQAMGTIGRMPFLSHAAGFTSFNSYFDNNPLCCPTRTTLLTGLYSHHTGITTNEVAQRFDPSSTLATWLQGAGYETALYGKYLNLYPWNRGPGYVPPGWDRWGAFVGDENYYGYTLNDESGTTTHYGHAASDYSTDVLAAKATDFVSSAQQPFFLYFAPNAPHSPRIPAPRYRDAFAHEHISLPPNFNRPASPSPAYWTHLPAVSATEQRAQIRAEWQALLSVDDAVKQLFASLSAAGELDNTIVIYLSDNGYAFGSHRNTQKDCPYEECVHLPLLIRWPGAQAMPSVGALVSSIDIAPTIADMTGVSPPSPVDGQSLVPLMTGQATTLDRPVLIQHVHYTGTAPTLWAIRTESWMYAEYHTGERELYNLDSDPYELRNLAGRPAYRARERSLAAQLERLRR